MAQPIKTAPDRFTIFANNNTLNEFDPTLAALANGLFMIGFTRDSAGDLSTGQGLHESSGGGSGNFIANNAAVDEQHASISGFGSGAMTAFAWTEKNESTGEFDIYARVSTAGTNVFRVGTDILPRFLVNAGAVTGVQDRPEIVALGDDRFAVAWIDRNTSKVNYAVYDINGGAIFAPAQLSVSNATQPFGSPTARIDILDLQNGTFVVAYRADNFEAKFRIANTIPQVPFRTGEIDVDDTNDGNGKSGMALLADGRFVIVYQMSSAIKGRIFNPDGTASTPVFTVSPIVSADSLPQVTGLEDGRFMAVMGDGADIVAQVMLPDGTPDGDPFVVNDVTTGAQTRPVISTLADGRVVVAWETTEAGNLDIKHAIYDPRQAGVIVAGTGVSDDFVGSRFNDTLSGGNGTDRLKGGEGNDSLLGGSGGDDLEGEGGDDTLHGGPGADRMVGGAGNDRYVVDNAGDVVTENVSQGLDTVQAFLSHTLVANVENLILEGGNTATGNTENNRIDGHGGNSTLNGQSGNDLLLGYGGEDFLNGGQGADTMLGGSGNDRYHVDNVGDVVTENAGEGLDTVQAFLNHTLAANVENLVLQGGTTGTGNTENNRIDGNGADNSLNGLNGNDFLLGHDGEDRLDGGNGADTMVGGRGNDRYVVDHVSDVVTEKGGEGLDIVEAYLNYTIALNVENVVLQGGTTVIGNAENNRIDGHGGNNILSGRDGMDLLLGYGGNDTLEGGADDDIFVFTNGTGSDTIVDMQGGISAGDKIDIRNFGFASFDAVMAATTDVSGGARIQLDGDDSVFVQNMSKAQFDSNDFLLT